MGPTTAIGQSGKIERDVENKGGLYVQAKGPEHVPPNGSKLRIKRKAHPVGTTISRLFNRTDESCLVARQTP